MTLRMWEANAGEAIHGVQKDSGKLAFENTSLLGNSELFTRRVFGIDETEAALQG